MFIRFMCGEIDERSHLAGGLFCAIERLESLDEVPEYELEAVGEVILWFNRHLRSPFHYLPEVPRYDPAVCWFKSTADEHLAKAWELVTILERNDILIWTIKARRIGLIHYEDEFQVFARPDRYVRHQL